MVSRRRFLKTTASVPVAGATLFNASQPATWGEESARKRLAIVTTVWKYLSHAQHMGDRFLVGYPHAGQWMRPAIDVVSLYVDQRPDQDQSRQRAEEFGFTIYDSIAAALRQGGDKLAVDAVLLIGEHGDYPRNELGQIQYPRYEFFEQIVRVFREDGRSVPVFNDKHLSYDFRKAERMVVAAKELDFPLMAGSSLPVTWRLPNVEMPWGAKVEEALMVGTGGSDPMDFHALEAMQCMLERRSGGETGVRSVQMLTGPAVWQEGEQGRWSLELLEAALSRSNELQGLSRSDARPQDLVRSPELQRLARDVAAYFIQYRDGTQATLLMLTGAVNDFTFAARLAGVDQPLSTLFYLPPTPNVVYSAELMHHVGQMFLTQEAQYPVERTLLVSGVLQSCLQSRHDGEKVLMTPHLNVAYQANQESNHAQQ